MSEEIRKRDERGVRIMGAYAKKYQKSDDCIGDMNDLDALLTVSIEQLGERKAGRLSSFPDNQEGMEAFVLATQRYFQYIADANKKNEEKLIPDIEGWCIFLGITKQTVLNYAKRSQDWADTIEYIKESILAAKKQLAFRFKIPPVVYLNDVSNNHDYLNTNEFKLVTSNKNNEMTPTRTAAEIAERHKAVLELPEMERPEL
nr:MAG TPA: DNA packaging protein gp3 [Bacteriophage sp.]